MEDQGITREQVQAALQEDFAELAGRIAAAMNAAQAGRIIADSEEGVRDAHAEFRQRSYQTAVELLQSQRESFSPSAPSAAEQGPATDDASDGQRQDCDSPHDLLVGPSGDGGAGGPVAGHPATSIQPRGSGDVLPGGAACSV